ncbi:hypothetical protein OO012_11880 [Rhodobacteraceae bacterium KMM 6894]|nr:hypothetical protein [Rhodobacteraceae bacterium KMM 6894]
MDHISRAGPRVPPTQPASRLASEQDRRDRRARHFGRTFAQDDPIEVPPDTGGVTGTKSGLAGPVWWYADACDMGQCTPDEAVRQNRLRTAQMLRAVRNSAAIGGAGTARNTAGVTGEILDADDPGGGDARVIAPGKVVKSEPP